MSKQSPRAEWTLLKEYLEDLKSSIEDEFPEEEVGISYTDIRTHGRFELGCTLYSSSCKFIISQKSIEFFLNQIDYIQDIFSAKVYGSVTHVATNRIDEFNISLDCYRSLDKENNLQDAIVEIDVKFNLNIEKHIESFRNFRYSLRYL